MTADELARELASGDEQAVRRAVRACGERLRDEEGEDAAELVATLAPLAEHASAVVRQAVADVCDVFPAAEYEETHARLLADRDAYVMRAAEAAGHRRAQQRRVRAKVVAVAHGHDANAAEMKRRHGKEALKLAERMVESGVEQFVQMLHHEMRKPKNAVHLAHMKALAELARPERSIVAIEAQLRTSLERAMFAFTMVDRARDYATREKPVFAEANLATLVDEARVQLMERMGTRAAKIVFTNDVAPDLRAQVDRRALLQALQNVLQNAVEAYADGAAKTPVRVVGRLQRDATEIELRVSDDGVGIPADRIASLFIPFGSRKPGGTGVGLLIVRRAVEEIHGGALDFPSTAQGTTVTMVIPVRQRA